MPASCTKCALDSKSISYSQHKVTTKEQGKSCPKPSSQAASKTPLLPWRSSSSHNDQDQGTTTETTACPALLLRAAPGAAPLLPYPRVGLLFRGRRRRQWGGSSGSREWRASIAAQLGPALRPRGTRLCTYVTRDTGCWVCSLICHVAERLGILLISALTFVRREEEARGSLVFPSSTSELSTSFICKPQPSLTHPPLFFFSIIVINTVLQPTRRPATMGLPCRGRRRCRHCCLGLCRRSTTTRGLWRRRKQSHHQQQQQQW